MKEIITVEKFEDECKLGDRAVEIDTRTQATEMREIVKELKDTMRKKGIKSLSAPAIGYNRRIFCIDFEDLEIKTFINPIICQAKGLSLSRETCTSIPGKTFIRPRSNDIMVMYQSPTGKPESRQIVGLAAYVFQHELDHLDGLLISDVGLEIDEMFDNATDEEREEVINAYLDSLDLKQKEVQKEIDEDKDLKRISDGIKFMEGVAKGEIEQMSIDEKTE